MYEDFYGFAEKPFSLTPDPKYLYRSQSHANAFELLQYAIRRREGFVVVTGDIGTGKTTLCRALLEQIDRTTFTALVLNPFLSEEDLLKRILLHYRKSRREFRCLRRELPFTIFGPWAEIPYSYQASIGVQRQIGLDADVIGRAGHVGDAGNGDVLQR